MKNTDKKKISGSVKAVRVCGFFAYIFIILLMFAVKDFAEAAMSGKDTYDVRLTQIDTVDNGQEIWQLYVNGEYRKDIDINEYSLMDSEGNTDYKYCFLMDNAKGLAYAVILSAMVVLVLLIANSSAKGTPFVRANVRRIYAIGWLQLALAVVPGLVVFIMKFFRFEYSYMPINLNSVYMFLIAVVIMLIAQVFARGVELQEDSDSIA